MHSCVWYHTQEFCIVCCMRVMRVDMIDRREMEIGKLLGFSFIVLKGLKQTFRVDDWLQFLSVFSLLKSQAIE